MVKTTDPLNRVTQFVNCPCGAMDKIIDAGGNETEWTRDLQKRITSKKIAGQTVASYTYEADTGRLKTVTDGKGQVMTYAYTADDRVASITYSNAGIATPTVSFAYDSNYPRLSSMTDGTGTTAYGYVPINPADTVYGDGELATVDGPLGNDTIGYSYDELGRATGRTINGSANSSSVSFDALGRVGTVTNPLGSFGHFYVNQTGRLEHVTYPNGQQTMYAWYSNAQDRRLKEIKHLDAGSAVLSKFNYEQDAEGRITKWTKTLGAAGSASRYDLGYDDANQLTAAVLKDTVTEAELKSYGYGYDLSGNRIGFTEDGVTMSTPANSANQLTSKQASGGMMLFKGTVSEPATITLAGVPATVSGLNWEVAVPVSAGANHLPLQATETSGVPAGLNAQMTVRHIDFTLDANLGRSFGYDDNGSMTSNQGLQSYEWDAANRLVAINYVGTNKRTEFTYDGLSRRVTIVEKTGTTVASDKRFVWDGMTIAEERDSNNNITKRFFAQGVGIGGASYYYTRDHLGSVRELTDSTGDLRARYDYTPWGERMKLSGDLEADFGFTVGSSRVDLQACKLEYSIVSPK